MNEHKIFSYPKQPMDEWITSFYRVRGVESHLFNFHSHQEMKDRFLSFRRLQVFNQQSNL